MKPVVLLATTRLWAPVARLAMTLANAGFNVEAVCPSGHPVTRTRAVSRTFAYRGLAPLPSFAEAFFASKPDLVIPGDDLAAEQLHDLYFRERPKHDSAAKALCTVIERSLGAPESYSVVHERSTFIQVAAQEGDRVPRMALIKTFTARFAGPKHDLALALATSSPFSRECAILHRRKRSHEFGCLLERSRACRSAF